MKHLSALNKYFWKYRVRFLAGIIFVIVSNYFAVLVPEVTGYVVGQVQQYISDNHTAPKENYSLSIDFFISWIKRFDFKKMVVVSSIAILLLSMLRGLLMFFMRQTLIVMSRHIEYDLKNE